MELRQLQYMLKVAEEGRFSKAAQKLYISQPSLSQLNKLAITRPPWAKIHLADLREEPFLLLKKGRKLRELADQSFINLGFTPRKVLICSIGNQLT